MKPSKRRVASRNICSKTPSRLASIPSPFIRQLTSPWLPDIKQHNSRAKGEAPLCRVEPGAAWRR